MQPFYLWLLRSCFHARGLDPLSTRGYSSFLEGNSSSQLGISFKPNPHQYVAFSNQRQPAVGLLISVLDVELLDAPHNDIKWAGGY
jgi:hypothetical protein